MIASLSTSSRKTPALSSAVSANSDASSESIHSREKKAFKPVKRKIYYMFRKAKDKEKAGQWKEAIKLFRKILYLDPSDSHTHLALARLEAKREHASTKKNGGGHAARNAFQDGSQKCPNSVHIWQAWAQFEAQSCHDIARARELFNKALEIEDSNPYVCHSFGLMEKRRGNTALAKKLWEQGLKKQPTAALVCSFADLLIEDNKLREAREVYQRYLTEVKSERQMTEIYLASAWLEEKFFRNFKNAKDLIELALSKNPHNSRAHVALARLEGRHNRRRNESGKIATRKRLTKAVQNIENDDEDESSKDGRLFNALANVEVKLRKFAEAKQVLERGIERFPEDVSLLNAAGKVEERLGNMTQARKMYNLSISRQPSAPAHVALAMMELRHPEVKPYNYTLVTTHFERALLLDSRHGPAYNAYGNMQFRRGNLTEARYIYRRGVQAECSDPASVYHGLAKIELSMGNVDLAREILLMGLKRVEAQGRTMDSTRHERAVFLVHTLGMLELNSNRIVEASRVFSEGMVKYPRCSQLMLGAALCATKLGSTDKARILFNTAVKADKRHAQAWHAWGMMESRAGNISITKTLFEAGIKNRPTYGALWHAYGVLEGRMDQVEHARSLFRAGLEKCPDYIPLHLGLAGIEMKDGNLKEAKKVIGEALTIDKTRGSSWLAAAQIEKQQGNQGLVGLILRRGIECAPAEAALYRELGEHLVQKGKINEARQVLEKGLELNPLHAPLYHSLAELEARIFNLEGLAKLNERAAKIYNTNALIPSPSTAEAWGNKLRMGKSREVPNGLSALAEKVGHSDITPEKIDEAASSATPLDSMSDMEDQFVQELFQDDLDDAT
eukprot:CAMPEP_0194214360 /NCGR_PEP_ID=MMETSP0156-20130528/15510_1 /TAXON_ID=33649 /ORGANISM="Thalassionema nitzschioides, Strain L26-B" /LENGTH=845 /DNA_ID=CAMNT_0038942593 /DNA_START=229 /DNA_END=2766 /DNA_ORIENTATION=-